MPITVTSPKHSFVNLNGLLSDIILPAYNGIDIAFQFTFSPESKVSLTTAVKAGVAYTSGGIINASFDVTNVCAWGVFEEINLETDFPITVTTFPLAGTYEAKEDLLLAVRTVYNIDATGQTFLQCCSLDALPQILFSYTNATSAAKSAGINFYKGLQFVNINAGFGNINAEQCFRYVIIVSGQNFLSNLFKRVATNRFLTEVIYSNNEDAYGFRYKDIYPIESMPATPPTSGPVEVTKVNSVSWGFLGAYVYEPGYPLSGIGTIAAHLTIPHFWVNGDHIETQNGPTCKTTYGRMNANGVWGLGNTGNIFLPTDEWIGFTRKITLSEAKVLYVGISGDDFIKLRINGVEILNTFEDRTGGFISYAQWGILPVNFAAGDNYLEMYARNSSTVYTYNPGGFGCEIYDMTLAQLQAATQESDLNIIFRTADMVGQPFDLGTTIGYSCPDGWILRNNGDSYSCFRTGQSLSVFNKLHLPVITKKPVYPENRKVYIKSNKQYKVQYSNLEKQWECKTEDLPDEMHEKIAVMLAHDNIHFTNSKIDADIFKKDDYAIDWDNSDLAETAIATFKINTVFEGRNSNCEKKKVCSPAIQAVECIAVSIDSAFSLTNAVVNQAYNAYQQILIGTPPFTITVIAKPSWMSVRVQGSNIAYSGIPLNAASNQPVQISISNCGSTVSFSDSLNITSANSGDGNVMFGTPVSQSQTEKIDEVPVIGVANSTVTITLTTYVNTNGGMLRINGTNFFINQPFDVVLNNAGSGSFTASIIGEVGNSGTIIRGIFTITAATAGEIGANDTYEITQVF